MHMGTNEKFGCNLEAQPFKAKEQKSLGASVGCISTTRAKCYCFWSPHYCLETSPGMCMLPYAAITAITLCSQQCGRDLSTSVNNSCWMVHTPALAAVLWWPHWTSCNKMLLLNTQNQGSSQSSLCCAQCSSVPGSLQNKTYNPFLHFSGPRTDNCFENTTGSSICLVSLGIRLKDGWDFMASVGRRCQEWVFSKGSPIPQLHLPCIWQDLHSLVFRAQCQTWIPLKGGDPRRWREKAWHFYQMVLDRLGKPKAILCH